MRFRKVNNISGLYSPDTASTSPSLPEVTARNVLYMCICAVMSESLQLHGLQPARLPCPWDCPGKNTGVGCHFFLQGIFLNQGLNPGLLNCRQILNRKGLGHHLILLFISCGNCFNLWTVHLWPRILRWQAKCKGSLL